MDTEIPYNTNESSTTCCDVIRLNLPASFKYLNVLSATIAEILGRVDGLAEADATIYNIQLAAQEACTNIVDHAYKSIDDGRIAIQIEFHNMTHTLVIDIQDTGQSFNIEEAKSPNLGTLQIRGLGLFLMRELLDDVQYFPQPGNNRWRLTKQFCTERS